MGRTPFLYFADHPPELGAAIHAGRQAEFEAEFAAPKLAWSEPAGPRGSRMLAWYRALLALRRSRPELAAGRHAGLAVEQDASGTWIAVRRGDVVLASNLGRERCRVTVGGAGKGCVLLTWGEPPREAGDGEVELEPRSTAVLEAPVGQGR